MDNTTPTQLLQWFNPWVKATICTGQAVCYMLQL